MGYTGLPFSYLETALTWYHSQKMLDKGSIYEYMIIWVGLYMNKLIKIPVSTIL